MLGIIRRLLTLCAILICTGLSAQQISIDDFGSKRTSILPKHKRQSVVNIFSEDTEFAFSSEKYPITAEKGDGVVQLLVARKIDFIKISHPKYGVFNWKPPVKKLKGVKEYHATIITPDFKEFKIDRQWLTVESNPSNAIIRVDSTYKRSSSGKTQFHLPMGEHVVVVTAPFFKDAIDTITIDRDRAVVHRVDLEPNYSLLTVKSQIDGAKIYIDNRAVGVGSIEGLRVESGRRSITIIDSNITNEHYHREYHNSIDLSIGERATIYAKRDEFIVETSPIKKVIAATDSSHIEMRDTTLMKTEQESTPTIDSTMLTIKAFDQDCGIYINNELYGQGEWSGRLKYARYLITNKRDGYSSKPIFVDLYGVKPMEVELDSPLSNYGTLTISCNRVGSEVYVNGNYVGLSPITLQNIKADVDCRVRVQRAGSRYKEKIIYIKPNRENSIEFKLK